MKDSWSTERLNEGTGNLGAAIWFATLDPTSIHWITERDMEKGPLLSALAPTSADLHKPQQPTRTPFIGLPTSTFAFTNRFYNLYPSLEPIQGVRALY